MTSEVSIIGFGLDLAKWEERLSTHEPEDLKNKALDKQALYTFGDSSTEYEGPDDGPLAPRKTI